MNVSWARQYPIKILPFNLFRLVIVMSHFFLESLGNKENILFNKIFTKGLFSYVKPCKSSSFL